MFIAEDHDWYRKRLEESARDQMFDIDFLCEINKSYENRVNRRAFHYDFVFNVSNNQYPHPGELEKIMLFWEKRLELIGDNRDAARNLRTLS